MSHVKQSGHVYLTWVSCLLIAGLVMAVVPAHAQISSATINGTVRDTTGAVIPGSPV